MAETLLTSSVITREIMMVLKEKLTFLKKINKQYDDSFKCNGAKAGDTLKIRLPSNGVVRTGRVMDLQEKQDRSVDLVIANQWGIDLGASSSDMALKIDDFRERYIEPKVATLASKIEAQVISDSLKKIGSVAGDYGAFDDFSTVLEANQKLSNNLAPQDGRIMYVATKAENTVLDAFKTYYNSQRQVSDQYTEGSMGRMGGFDWYSSGLVPVYTRGTANTSYTLNGVPASGASVLAVTAGSGTLKAGDVITLASTNACHPQTKADQGYVREFTVTADYSGGAGNVSISPPIYTSGPEQNVYAAPASNAVVTVKGSSGTAYNQNVAFTRDAFCFVTADLPLPPGKDATRMSNQGLSLRYINDYDTVNDMFISRVDILWGSAVLRPELACRIPSTL